MSELSPAHQAALRRCPMFSEIDAGELGELLHDCRVVRSPAGRMIFHAAQEADRFFIVLEGRVKVFKLSARGDEQILHLFGPGETFGEAAMWARVPFPAHAEATRDAVLLVVGRDALGRAIRRRPELALGMLAGMSAKLREFNRLIGELSLKEVPARLASVLLRMSRQAGGARTVRLNQTKRQLAAQIGTVAETLSRSLAKLKAAELIDVKGSTITLRDVQGLEDLAVNG